MSGSLATVIDGITPAEIELDGIAPTIPTGAGYATLEQEIAVSPAEIEIEGVAPSAVTASSVELVVTPAEIEMAGGGSFLLGAQITVSPAEIEIEGSTIIVGFGVEVEPAELELEGIPAAGITASSIELVVSPAEIEIGGVPPSSIFTASLYRIFYLLDPAQITLSGCDINISLITETIEIYKCFLIENMDFLELPASTFQVRLRNGEPSYLQVTVPNASEYINMIQEKTNGEITIRRFLENNSGINNSVELARVSFDALSYGKGVRNWTATLSGNKTTENTSPKTVALSGVSILSLQSNGMKRIRSKVNFYVRPGDIVTWDEVTMTAGLITITVGHKLAYMDITEADT